jgi:hypothetical protein
MTAAHRAHAGKGSGYYQDIVFIPGYQNGDGALRRAHAGRAALGPALGLVVRPLLRRVVRGACRLLWMA